jgi:hypothetical protein
VPARAARAVRGDVSADLVSPVGVPVTLRENLLRKAFLLLLLTLLATGSIAKLSSGDHGFENWVGAILAPPAALLLGYVTLRGPRTLHLDERGFVATSGLPWRPPLDVAWRDVEVFTTERPGDGPASVWYQLRPAASRLPRRYRWMRRLIETPDNGLPTTYGGMSAVELGAYLERWREHATSQDAPSTGRSARWFEFVGRDCGTRCRRTRAVDRSQIGI